MVLKNVSAAALGTMLLAWSSLSMADGYRPAEYRASEYRASEFLGLDLSSAVLSPKPLGPATEFAPVAVEAKADRGGEAASVRVARVAHLRNAKARGAAPMFRLKSSPDSTPAPWSRSRSSRCSCSTTENSSPSSRRKSPTPT